jgi:hypothetical protein
MVKIIRENILRKYLYLTKVEWANTWVYGGVIPISLASNYLSQNRVGKLTPDENLIYQSQISVHELRKNGLDIRECKNLHFKNCSFGGLDIEELHVNYYTEDGIILSFSNLCSMSICKGLEKMVCVSINNMLSLKICIDEQLDSIGKMAHCMYTNDHLRTHFLKSAEDSWQDEYRMFWPINQEKWVQIPKGTAKLMFIMD